MGIAIVFFDRTVRYTRMFFIHMNWTSGETGGTYKIPLRSVTPSILTISF